MNKEKLTIKDTLPLVGFPGAKLDYLRFLTRKGVIIHKNHAPEVYIKDGFFYYETEEVTGPNGKIVTRKRMFVRPAGVLFLKSVVRRWMPQIMKNISQNGKYN